MNLETSNTKGICHNDTLLGKKKQEIEAKIWFSRQFEKNVIVIKYFLKWWLFHM